MIDIEITEIDHSIKKVEVKGHSDYDDIGKDIVCAAVSTLVFTVAQALVEYFKIPTISVYISEDELNPHFIISDETDRLPEQQSSIHNNFIILVLLNTLVLGLRNIQEEFPDYVKIKNIIIDNNINEKIDISEFEED